MNNKAADKPDELLHLLKTKLPVLYHLSENSEIKPLKYSENITFVVEDSAQGLKTVLRVNRPGYHTLEELEDEILWMDDIRRDTPLIIPEVIPGRDGKNIESFTSPETGIKYYCSMLSFLEGEIIKKLTGEELLEQAENVGMVAAVLHTQAEYMDSAKKLKRFTWDYETTLKDDGRWGNWRNYNSLSKEDIALFEKACDVIRRRLKKYGKDPHRYGIIHADLHFSNFIIHENKLQLIDFDDCGFGWFLYDIGCSVVEYNSGIDELVKCWVKGYEGVRRLTDEDRTEIPTFILMRRLLRLAWLSSHADSDTAKGVGREYLTVTINMAEKYIKENL